MIRTLLFLVPVVVCLAGCAGNTGSTTENNVDANGNAISSVPWNKPESWETSGQLGGATR